VLKEGSLGDGLDWPEPDTPEAAPQTTAGLRNFGRVAVRFSGGQSVLTDAVYQSYTQFCQNVRERFPKEPHELGEFLAAVEVERQRVRLGGKRPYVYHFKPLAEHREHFTDKTDVEFDGTKPGEADLSTVEVPGLEEIGISDWDRWRAWAAGETQDLP
jgi:hypothetical protein